MSKLMISILSICILIQSCRTVYRREPEEIKVKVEPTVFSPNGDFNNDYIFFSIDISEEYNVEFWELLIKNLKGDTLFRHKDSKMKTIYAYNGSINRGKKLREGTYRYEVCVYQKRGKPMKVSLGKIKVDFTRPILNVSTNKNVITPNGNGIDDNVTFKIEATDKNKITRCEIKITDENGAPVKTISFNYSVSKFTWDGMSDVYKKIVPEGKYVAQVTVWDTAGNKTTSPKVYINIKNTTQNY